MAISLPREVTIGACVIIVQLIYSQIYPVALQWAGLDAPTENKKQPQPVPPPTPSPSVQVPLPSKEAQPQQGEAKSREEHEKPGEERAAEEEHFAASKKIRRRPRAAPKSNPAFYVGEVVRDKILFSRGVIVGWDLACQAPDWWRRSRLAFPNWEEMPHYLILADLRDLVDTNYSVNLTFYAPEATLERLAEGLQPLVSPELPKFFELYDTSADRYVPTREISNLYPDDVPPHYRKGKAGQLPDSDTRGKPLLRVVEFGRLIAHGSPVPVVRRAMFLVATETFPGDFFKRTVILLLKHDDEEGSLGVIVNKNHSIASAHRAAVEAASKRAGALAQQVEQLQRADERGDEEASKILPSLEPLVRHGSSLMKLVRTPGVELRLGGPVGLEEFPLGPHHVILHPFPDIKGRVPALAGSGSASDPDLYFNMVGEMRHKDIVEVSKRVRDMEYGKVIVFQGNSGWGAKQLAGEIRGGLHGTPSWSWVSATSREVLELPSVDNSSRSSIGSRKGRRHQQKERKGKATQSDNHRHREAAVGDAFWRRLITSDALQRMTLS